MAENSGINKLKTINNTLYQINITGWKKIAWKKRMNEDGVFLLSFVSSHFPEIAI